MGLLDRLEAKISRLPIAERRLPIVVVNGFPLSWNVVLQEARAGTEIGKQALSQLALKGLI